MKRNLAISLVQIIKTRRGILLNLKFVVINGLTSQSLNGY